MSGLHTHTDVSDLQVGVIQSSSLLGFTWGYETLCTYKKCKPCTPPQGKVRHPLS